MDGSLPGLSGLELQKRIAAERKDMPIIFITGHGDIPMTVQAMKAGAVEFLTKPFAEDLLMNAVRNEKAPDWQSFAVVDVTGASQGIAAAIARAFLDRG